MKQNLKKDILIFIGMSSVVSILLLNVFSQFEEKTVIANQLVQMGYFEKIQNLKIEKIFTETESSLVEALQRKDFLKEEFKNHFESLEKNDPLLKIYAKNLYAGKVEFFIVNKTGDNLSKISSALVEYIKQRHQKEKDNLIKNLKEDEKKSLVYKDASTIGPVTLANRTNKPHISLIVIAGILVGINFVFFSRL